MARDTLTVNLLGIDGAQKSGDVTVTAMTAANDMQFINDGKVLIYISNEGTTDPQTATFKGVNCSHCGKLNDFDVAVGANDIQLVGPFNPDYWNQSDGYVHIDSATEDSFNFAAFKINPAVNF